MSKSGGVASLSAILLEDAYYRALMDAKSIEDGVTIANIKVLIPLKARAFLNLSECKEYVGDIGSESIKKHKNEVFRLAQLPP